MPRTRSEPPPLHWQSFVHHLPDGSTCQGHRSAVPGGWIVMLPTTLGGGAFFFEDPSHRWAGEPIPASTAASTPRSVAREPSTPPAKKSTRRSSSRTTPTLAPLAWQSFLHQLPKASPREGFRAPVPGGWFVMFPLRPGGGVFFYRDAEHAWGAEHERALAGTATMIGSGPFARAKTLLVWQPVRHAIEGRSLQEAYRARVPGGWFVLVALDPGGGVFFFADPTSNW